MTFVLCILFIMAVVFGCVCENLSARLDYANGRIAILEDKVNYFKQSEKTLRESVDLQTKCIRDLNNVVKKSVEEKEPTEPDTKALLAGWVIEEPLSQIDSFDSFRTRKLISSLHCKNITPLYPWQQSELDRVLGIIKPERK